MWIVATAWMYVATMMALAEATSTQGSILGAVITFVMYGLAPTALVMYLLGTPGRRRARLAAEAAERARATEASASAALSDATPSAQTDAGRLPAGDPVAPERKEP